MVLRGMRGLLARNPDMALVFEFIPPFLVEFGDEPRALLERLERDGFRLSIVDYKERRLIESNAALIMARCGAEPDLLNILVVPGRPQHAGAEPRAHPADRHVITAWAAVPSRAEIERLPFELQRQCG